MQTIIQYIFIAFVSVVAVVYVVKMIRDLIVSKKSQPKDCGGCDSEVDESPKKKG
ncbi:MAG: FeoB-associated Cys-rich membrane protein [Weeksellaceae bacterium]